MSTNEKRNIASEKLFVIPKVIAGIAVLIGLTFLAIGRTDLVPIAAIIGGFAATLILILPLVAVMLGYEFENSPASTTKTESGEK